MTAESLVKARAAKIANAVKRLEQARKDVMSFRAWLVREREAYELRNRYAREQGRDSVDFMLTDILWRETIKAKPEAPPDWMWRVIRGEQPQEDDS